MTTMINVAVAGYAGRMGSAVVDAVTAAEDLTLVCGVDPYKKPVSFPTYQTISEALEKESFDVLVDFTQPDVVAETLKVALPAGVNCCWHHGNEQSNSRITCGFCAKWSMSFLCTKLYYRSSFNDGVR